MTVIVTIEFASSTDFKVMRERADKVKMHEDKINLAFFGHTTNIFI